MTIMTTLYDVATRNDAPPDLLAWLWETHRADDRDERLAGLRDALADSLQS